MTKLADLITVEHRNVRSVNVEQELRSSSPLGGFVVTEQVLDGIRRLLPAFRAEPTTRAWSITGPYGAGKSSFAHFVCALLADSGRDTLYEGAFETLEREDPELAQHLVELRENLGVADRGVIRAAATAEREPVAATVARALHRGAETYWAGRRGPRPAVLKALQAAAKSIARGDHPDPRFVQDALEQLIARAPVVIVLDELGKALEFAADRSRESDLYLLQQLAERFSGSDTMVGAVVALQHLAFEDYASGLSASRRLEWRKIQGRFEDVPFAGGSSHAAALIADSLKASHLPKTIATQYEQATSDLLVAAPEVKQLLSSLGAAPGGYPLHPTAIPALVELAGRFGQHDRSLMAFLTSDDPHALPAFMRDQSTANEVPFVRLDRIYDYFVAGAAALAVMGEDAARLREIRGRLAEAKGLDELELQCLKTVGVLNLVPTGDYRATDDVVPQAIVGPHTSPESRVAVEGALTRLQDQGLLTYRDFAREYRVWQGSDFDVAAAIAERREQLSQDAVLQGPPVEHIAAAYPARPLVASSHSQRVETLRYFEARYAVSLEGEPPVCEAPDADGLVIYLLATEVPDRPPHKSTADGRPLMTLVSRATADVTDAAVDAAATRYVLEHSEDLQDDVVARREVRHRAALAQATLTARIQAAFNPGDPRVTCYARGKRIAIKSRRGFADLLSALCDEVYYATPIVRNEMLNRRELTSQGAKARRELLQRMLTLEQEEKLGITGFGPDRAIYDAVLAATGLHSARNGALQWGAPSSDDGITPGWEAINAFLDAATDNPVSIGRLYDLLMAPPHGMKDGPIPVLLAAALAARRDDVFVFEEGTFLPRLAAEHFERLVKTPNRFSAKRAGLLGVRGEIFAELEKLAAGEAPLPAGVRNATTLRVIRPLVSMLQELPDYSRQTLRVSGPAQAVRDALATSREPDDLLFRGLPQACEVQPLADASAAQAAEFVTRLKAALDELTGAYATLTRTLAKTLRQAFDTRGPEHALREELRTRSRHLVEHVIDRRLRSFLLMAANEEFEDQEWLEAIATVLAQKPPGSWNDTDIAAFESATLETARTFRRLESLHYETASPLQDGFEARRLTLTQPDGTEASEVILLDESQSKALTAIVEDALTQAESLGPKAHEGLLTLLAEQVLADPAAKVNRPPALKEARRAS